jgi:hypothetical protein
MTARKLDKSGAATATSSWTRSAGDSSTCSTSLHVERIGDSRARARVHTSEM